MAGKTDSRADQIPFENASILSEDSKKNIVPFRPSLRLKAVLGFLRAYRESHDFFARVLERLTPGTVAEMLSDSESGTPWETTSINIESSRSRVSVLPFLNTSCEQALINTLS